MYILNVSTNSRTELKDITPLVERHVKSSEVQDGVIYIYTPHTTAAITINENADRTVKFDINNFLNKLIPYGNNYTHLEGNSDAHIKSSIVGCSETVFIENNSLILGTWQGIFFCEFDGPRNRKVLLKILKS